MGEAAAAAATTLELQSRSSLDNSSLTTSVFISVGEDASVVAALLCEDRFLELLAPSERLHQFEQVRLSSSLGIAISSIFHRYFIWKAPPFPSVQK